MLFTAPVYVPDRFTFQLKYTPDVPKVTPPVVKYVISASSNMLVPSAVMVPVKSYRVLVVTLPTDSVIVVNCRPIKLPLNVPPLTSPAQAILGAVSRPVLDIVTYSVPFILKECLADGPAL